MRKKEKFDFVRAVFMEHAPPEGISCAAISSLAAAAMGVSHGPGAYVWSVMRQLEQAGEAEIKGYGMSPSGAPAALWGKR